MARISGALSHAPRLLSIFLPSGKKRVVDDFQVSDGKRQGDGEQVVRRRRRENEVQAIEARQG
jgi:hypothetical protein